ncbi:MAG: hypothetical protein KME21_30675 [Desmonostoc vinosum HA7617-LM4]|jgi:hypothetical protein|nr:hypothetical protein [Desmonostoc vinosum HA7617-LM4]
MQPTISIARDWDYPRYTFGQRTQQGIIVGMDYYPKDTYLAQEYDEGWRYSVMPNKHTEDLYHFMEYEIKPLSIQESLAEIRAELEQYQRQVVILQQQLLTMPGVS